MTKNFTENIPKWLIILGGFVYGTGFLIVFTFYNRIGIKNPGELFKIKYMHIGIIYLSFCLILIMPFIALFIVRKRIKLLNDKKETEISPEERNFLDKVSFVTFLPTCLLFLFWLLSLYILVFFSPLGLLGKHKIIIALSFIPIILISLSRILLDWLAKDAIDKNKIDKIDSYFRWFLLGLMTFFIVLFIRLYSETFGLFYSMICNGGYFFIFFVSILGIYAYRFIIRALAVNDKWYTIALWNLGVGFFFVVYYFSILTFTTFVYNYIPIERSGGDYTYLPNIIINFKENELKIIPSEIIEKDFTSKPLKIIEETDKSILVAVADKSIDWRCLWEDKRPKIYEVLNKSFSNVTYLQRSKDEPSRKP